MKTTIKLFNILLVLTFLSASFSGCKDPCKDAVCLNGGTCDDGDCDCPLGYTGEHCETEVDACTQVTCDQNQACVDGTCHNLPTAGFTFAGNGCTAACSILLTNSSLEATSYSWDFGDGSNSSEANPSHEYITGGTYTVVLTATNDYGSATNSQQVLIQSSSQQQLPTASFNVGNNGCTATCTVSFTNTSSNGTSYSWNFGDGSTATSSNASHSYNSGGSYTVTLTATNSYGSDQYQQTVTVGSAPTTVRITNIAILSAPLTNGGTAWDIGGDADVYFDMKTSGGSVISSSSGNEYTNVTSYPISWDYPTPLEITNLNQQYRVAIYDYDTTSGDDYMGQTNLFTFGSYTSYPSTITVTGSGVSVRFTVTWI